MAIWTVAIKKNEKTYIEIYKKKKIKQIKTSINSILDCPKFNTIYTG